MPTLGHAARVGAVVLIAVALFVWMWVFFVGTTLQSKTYGLDVVFDDATGIDKDAHVELAGVQIGSVQSVALVDHKANLHLRIRKDQLIPKGSQFTIVTPGLSTSGVIAVIPPADADKRPGDDIPPGTVGIHGERSGDLTAAMQHTAALMDQVAETAKKANELIDAATKLIGNKRLQYSLDRTASNLDAASVNGVRLTAQLNKILDQDNAELRTMLHDVGAGSHLAMNNLVDTTAQIRGTMRENKGKIAEIIGNLQDSTSAIAGLAAQTNDMMKDGGVSKNVVASAANLKDITDKLNVVAGNVEKLTGDQGIQADLKATLKNIRETTEQTNALAERLNHLAGGKHKTTAVIVGPGGAAVIVPPTVAGGHGVSSSQVAELPVRADAVQNTRTDHFRTDIDARLPISATDLTFGRAGIHGFGDENKLTLQFGKTLQGGIFGYRAGLYASKLSVGADVHAGRNLSFSLDIYDPNNLHIDARGVFMLTDELGLIAGAEELNRRSGPVFGVQFKH